MTRSLHLQRLRIAGHVDARVTARRPQRQLARIRLKQFDSAFSRAAEATRVAQAALRNRLSPALHAAVRREEGHRIAAGQNLPEGLAVAIDVVQSEAAPPLQA
jgi:hypothetical protein